MQEIFEVKYADGRPLDSLTALDIEQAQDIIEDEYRDAVYGEWELRGVWIGRGPVYRMLVWENEEEADEDAGAHAIAEILRFTYETRD